MTSQESRPGVGTGTASKIKGGDLGCSLSQPPAAELINTVTGEVITMMTEAEAKRITQRIELKLDTIASNAETVIPMIVEAYHRQAHKALGYPTWEDYYRTEFGSLTLRFAAVGNITFERRRLTQILADSGMSTRAIAPAVGANQSTVARDLQRRDASASPEADHRLRLQRIDPTLTDEDTEAICTFGDLDEESFEKALKEARADGDLSAQNVAAKATQMTKVTGIDGKTYSRPERNKPRRRPLPDAYGDAIYQMGKLSTTLENLHKDDRFKANRESVRHDGHRLALILNKLTQLLVDDLGIDPAEIHGEPV